MDSPGGKLTHFKKLAQDGDLDAQLRLAGAYLFGSAGKVDAIESMKWCKPALQKGSPLAKYFYGFYHFLGKGVPKDYAIAFRWWRESAEDGLAEGQAHTGWAYEQGIGVERNAELAAQWWLKAAEGGVVNAQLGIATYYEQGIGIPKDMDSAVFWLMIASRNGSKDAEANMRRLYAEFSPASQDSIVEKVEEYLENNPECLRKSRDTSGPAFLT